MNKMKHFIHELNYLKAENFISFFIFVFALIPSLFFRLYILIRRRKIWIICEDKNEARDNGYCFFKYLREKQPQVDVYYAIKYSSPDYSKVKSIGKTIRYGGMKHWILYLNCEYNISTQKAGKPDAAIGYVLEHLRIVKDRFIFLQHGITINKATWLFYNNTKMRLFICGAKPEYEYVKQFFGYPNDHVKYLGFSRFDEYHNIEVNTKQILLMPSWREWIASKNEYSRRYEDTSDFTNTEYYHKYQELINNSQLISFLKTNDCHLVFYPHRNMQKYINSFTTTSDRIKILSNKGSDIRELLIESAAMITDYSSVGIDFAYMKKPVLYYQFDEKRFREAQYAEGYYDYKKYGLGEVVDDIDTLIHKLQTIYDNNLTMSDDFEIAHKRFFELYDDKNSERIYNELKEK